MAIGCGIAWLRESPHTTFQICHGAGVLLLGLTCRIGFASAAAALCLVGASAIASGPEAVRSLFTRAIDSRFSLDSSQRVRLTTRSSEGSESVRVVEMALKQIDGRLHAHAVIVEPAHLRGTRVLSIEAHGRSDDQFIFMPSHARVRRISGAQRADLFFGTDVTLEDFERHYAAEFKLTDEGESNVRGEPVRMIAASPHFESNYDVALYMIAEDGMTLEIRFFANHSTAPRRIIRAYRSGEEGVYPSLFPAKLEIENHRRGTVTIVEFEKVVAISAPDAFFSTDSLESARSVPYLRDGAP